MSMKRKVNLPINAVIYVTFVPAGCELVKNPVEPQGYFMAVTDCLSGLVDALLFIAAYFLP